MNKPLIIKLGGSLLRHQHGKSLREIGKVISDLALTYPLLIVPGGGPFADTVRLYGQQLSLSDQTCHHMALMAMDEYAFLLSEFIPNSVITNLAAQTDSASLPAAPKVSILTCSGFFREISPSLLPRSWDVTSDSLAAYLAQELDSSLLIIVKSKNVEPLLKEPDIDLFFPKLLPLKTPVWFINGLYPQRLTEILHTGLTHGVYLPSGSTSARLLSP